jgi:class 3 adenylate cyclase
MSSARPRVLPSWVTGAGATCCSRHYATVRRELRRYRGDEVQTAGDGFLATFDGPARAIRCACAIRDRAHDDGLSIRPGLHTGECELMGSDIGGIAVHIGARVAALARSDEVLVSSTIKDLVVGSGIEFDDPRPACPEGRSGRLATVLGE